MANSDYFGLANSLSRARRPPAQNDVYMQQPRGVPAYAQQNRNNYTASATAPYAQASKPRDAYWYAPLPYGGMQQQGFGGGGFGSGLAGINATGGFQNPVSMAPPMSGGLLGSNTGATFMGGMGGSLGADPSPQGGPSPGVQMLPPPGGMQHPGFGGGPTMGGNMDPNTSRLARPNVPGFGGGPQPGPQPMMLPPNPYGGPKP
jgi:hypothetical protein